MAERLQFYGERLRRLRKRKGLSQAQIGKVAGVAGPTVGTWERGVSVPSEVAVETLAKYFGVEESEFWGRPDTSGRPDVSTCYPKTQGDVMRMICALIGRRGKIELEKCGRVKIEIDRNLVKNELYDALCKAYVIISSRNNDKDRERIWSEIFETWIEETCAALDERKISDG